MANNKQLRKARQDKCDEFYTQLSDIESELSHYSDYFRGKVIYCPCDDFSWSGFPQYFREHFHEIGIKKLVTSCFRSNRRSEKIEYDGKNVTVTPLKGHGDFRSQECVDLLDRADVIVTNPPFSLFRDFFELLTSHYKKFVIVGDINAISYKVVFPSIQNNTVWLGFSRNMSFVIPEHYRRSNNVQRTPNGKALIKLATVRWYSNVEPKPERHCREGIPYDPKNYMKMLNFDVICVDKMSEMPRDYYGTMAVPVSFFDEYNPDEFSILGGTSEFKVDSNGVSQKGILVNPDNGKLKIMGINGSDPFIEVSEPPTDRLYILRNGRYYVNPYKRFFVQRIKK